MFLTTRIHSSKQARQVNMKDLKSGFAETVLLLLSFFRVIYARVQCYLFSKSDRLTCLNAEQQEHLDDLQVDINRDDVKPSAGHQFDIIMDTSLRIRYEPGIEYC